MYTEMIGNTPNVLIHRNIGYFDFLQKMYTNFVNIVF